MIQVALNNKKILRHIPDTVDCLIIQEYFEINRNSDLNLIWNKKNVKFLSEEEIKEQNIKEYIIIDKINVGLYSADIYFEMMPEFWNGIITTFKKENGVWKHLEYL